MWVLLTTLLHVFVTVSKLVLPCYVSMPETEAICDRNCLNNMLRRLALFFVLLPVCM